MVLGESGSGKSASLRNFAEDEVVVCNVACKPLPFRKKLIVRNIQNAGRYDQIYNILGKAYTSGIRSFVIDDSQYLMAFEQFDRAKETGYAKFTDMATSFRNLIDFCVKQMPQDAIIYFLHHTETNDTGKIVAKTCGKMLSSQLTVEGLFSIVLLCRTDGNRHWFDTQSDGFTTAKSPMEMFDREIDNDLKFVDDAIREYYNIAKNVNQNKEKEGETKND